MVVHGEPWPSAAVLEDSVQSRSEGSLSCIGLTDEGARRIAEEHPDLARLRACNADKLTDEGMAALCSLEGLEELDLSGLLRVTPPGLGALSRLPQLRSLALWDVRVDDRAADALSELKGLRRIELCGASITGQGLASLTRLPELSALHLSRCFQLGTAALSLLSELPRLRELRIDGCPDCDEGSLASLEALQELERLDLSTWDRLGAVGLEHVARLPRLATLDLSQTAVTDEDLEQLWRLPLLAELDLTWCTQITDQALEILTGHRLRRLSLCTTRITDEGLIYLADMPGLQFVDLDGCAGLSEEAIKDLEGSGICVRR